MSRYLFIAALEVRGISPPNFCGIYTVSVAQCCCVTTSPQLHQNSFTQLELMVIRQFLCTRTHSHTLSSWLLTVPLHCTCPSSVQGSLGVFDEGFQNLLCIWTFQLSFQIIPVTVSLGLSGLSQPKVFILWLIVFALAHFSLVLFSISETIHLVSCLFGVFLSIQH